ncbi:efflux RND transporter permease subunit [Brevundimonas sp. PAMC22021]|uniref:efflux RND transporter permease subunit n=1 Tax=Brevundimonas sp. PAMC22021 TaxID=2861285 RepID=UPI001C626F07|nr:efflux RND transporter permease subunit [Brevundimonas sp. PAMC22021]QYF87396.1 efflux RND transporter permease subunit [Brevundimonas sp. PAMC22021]
MSDKRSPFDLSVERPILAAAMNLLLVALGLFAIFALPIREYPSIDPPTVSVRTQYIGAASEVVEREITQVIEDNLSGIEGVRQIQSQSRNESSSINIDFVAGTDIDAAAADIRDKVSAVRNDLPDDVEEPIIEKANADDQPTIWITLRSSELKPPELTDIADRLITDRIGVVPGVARVQIGGEKTYAMRIWLDRAAMAARDVTATDVIQRLEAENIATPAGRIETGQQDISIRAETRFADADEFRQLVLRDDGGDRVTLGDIATVEVGVEEYRTGLRSNGAEAVALGVVRQSNANTLEVAAGVREELDAVREAIPRSVQMTIDYDESVFISATLRNVATTLAQVIAVVVVVIWLFLGSWKATIIPALTIPASVIPAFLIAWTLGYSINVLTILAIILAISLTTDDAVVIVENVRRRQQQGEPMPIAALRATRQVGFATFASAAVLVAVILPLGLISGNVGRLFREFAVVLAAIVAFSTTAALTLAPMLSSKLFAKEEKPGRIARWTGKGLKKTSDGYGRVLERAIKRPVVPLIATAVLIGVGVTAFMTISREVAPNEDRAALRIQVEAPEGASFEYTAAKVAEIERIIQAKYMARPAGAEGEDEEKNKEEARKRPVASVLAIITPGYGGSVETNIANLILRLSDWGERDLSQEDFEQQLQGDLRRITGVRAFATSPPTLGQQRRGPQLQFVLSGLEREEVRGWAETLLGRAESVPGLQNPDLDYKDTRPELAVTIDRGRAAALGVDSASIGDALQVMFGSLQVTRYIERGEEYEVVVQAQRSDRDLPSDLENTYVRSTTAGGAMSSAGSSAGSAGAQGADSSGVSGVAAQPLAGVAGANDPSGVGRLVPLSAVVTLQERGAVRELNRLDRQTSISLESNLGPGASLGDAVSQLETIAEEELPAEAQIGYIGEALDFQETGASIYLILGLVLVLVYLILAGQFESFVHPLIILLSAPTALAGGVLTMWAFGLTLNIYTQIALILLVGLVAKNAILLVEFANQLRTEGKSVREAATGAAALRLRPILMTSVATILGAVPLVLESGAGAEARQMLGVVTSGGLLVGTLLTLFLVPVAYVLLGRFTPDPEAVRRELEQQEADTPEADGEGEGGGDDKGGGEAKEQPS